MSLPTQEYLRNTFSYDPNMGAFRWLIEPRPARPLIGKIAGATGPKGYVLIMVRCADGKRRAVGSHRLAWIYERGEIPEGAEVDHINGVPNKNGIGNLRPATSSQQKMNKCVQSNNRSGLKGAYYHACRKGKKWRSQIKVGVRLIFLGYFHTAQEAHQAYGEAAKRYFGEFARAA